MENIIVTTWRLGASYRKRLIHNIQKAIDTKYDKVQLLSFCRFF